jgi:stage II sporulation protein AB (anti-sigma F factor)
VQQHQAARRAVPVARIRSAVASGGGDDRQSLRAPRAPRAPRASGPRDVRVESNQTTLRTVNETIEQGRKTADGPIGFVCECGRLGCGLVIGLSLDDYEHVRADGRQFLVAPGHETADDQLVVAVDGRYTIVAKRGDAAVTAQLVDPRGEGPAVDLIWSGGERVSAISLTVEARPQSVREVRRRVLAFAEEHGAGRDLRGRIGVAVAEAVGNAVMHAYGGEDVGIVDVAIGIEEGDLQVVVADAGHGFRPGDPSGLGTGLSLIASTSDRFAIRERTPRGVEVSMRFAFVADQH